MFTNFITPARGRTRFYHCLRMRSLILRCRIAIPAPSRGIIKRKRRPRAAGNDFLLHRTIPDTIEYASSGGLIRQTFVSCFLRNKRRVRHREVTNVFDNSPAENVYIA